MILPGRLAYGHDGMVPAGENGFYDALGLLSIVSAIGITLMGIIAGKILQKREIGEYRKTLLLSVAGLALILAALLISPVYPVIKACWTTTYNFLAGGISFILMALFYLVVDVWKSRKWTLFFRVIGMNSIFIYLFVRIVPVGRITGYFTGWITKPAGVYGEPIAAVFCFLAGWLLLYYMYKKKIFVKV
jgi:predicted acyltransferase